MTRKLYVKSYGCQMNVYDSHRMADTLAPAGYVETATPDDADLIVLNTCHIREKAAEKVYSELGRMRMLKEAAAEQGRAVKIAVAGCVAQAEGAEIIRREKAVDLVVGPQSYHRLPEMLARDGKIQGKQIDTEFPVEDKFGALAAPGRAAIRKRGVSAFITVQEGCDKFCTFCVVPYTRGTEVSRPVAKIVAEAERLADAGVREITLLGQNVNAYHGDDESGRASSLGRLMHRLAEIPGIARLRYSTSHPCDMDDDLVAAHRDLPALMPQLHLPVQSGSDRILAAMNRRHSRADYLRTVERLRAVRPDIAFSSDFIVGFPGETDEDFRDTLRADRRGRFRQRRIRSSIRRGPARRPPRWIKCRRRVKDERLQRLQDDIERQQAAFMARCVGMTFDVLFEKAGREPGQIVGRSPYLQPVPVIAPQSLIGEIAPVRITEVRTNSLAGALVGMPVPVVHAHVEPVGA